MADLRAADRPDLILVPFGLSQMGRLESRSRSYLLFNLAGSLTLAGDAAATSQWGFLLLEGAWAVVSATGLIRAPDSAGTR